MMMVICGCGAPPLPSISVRCVKTSAASFDGLDCALKAVANRSVNSKSLRRIKGEFIMTCLSRFRLKMRKRPDQLSSRREHKAFVVETAKVKTQRERELELFSPAG
jgi:hypothetical protein